MGWQTAACNPSGNRLGFSPVQGTAGAPALGAASDLTPLQAARPILVRTDPGQDREPVVIEVLVAELDDFWMAAVVLLQ